VLVHAGVRPLAIVGCEVHRSGLEKGPAVDRAAAPGTLAQSNVLPATLVQSKVLQLLGVRSRAGPCCRPHCLPLGGEISWSTSFRRVAPGGATDDRDEGVVDASECGVDDLLADERGVGNLRADERGVGDLCVNEHGVGDLRADEPANVVSATFVQTKRGVRDLRAVERGVGDLRADERGVGDLRADRRAA
jgi:hypothetical protein